MDEFIRPDNSYFKFLKEQIFKTNSLLNKYQKLLKFIPESVSTIPTISEVIASPEQTCALFSDYETNIARLDLQVKENRKEIERRDGMYSVAERTNRDLLEENSKKDFHIQKLEKDILKAQNNAVEIETKKDVSIGKMRREIDKLRKMNRNLFSQLESTRGLIRKKDDHLKSLTKKYTLRRNETVSSSIDQQKEIALSLLKRDLKQARGARDEMKKNAGYYRQKEFETLHKYQSLFAEHKREKKRSEFLRKDIFRLQSQVSTTEGKLEEMRNRLKSEKKKVKEYYVNLLETLQKTNGAINRKSENAIATLEGRIGLLTRQMMKLKQTNLELQKRSTLSILETFDVPSYQIESERSNQQAEDLESLRAENARLKSDLEKIRDSLNEKENALFELKIRNDARIDTMKKNQKMNHLQMRVHDLEVENEDLNSRLIEAKRRREIRREILYKEKVNELRRSFNVEQKELRTQLNDSMEENKNSVRGLENELSDSKNKLTRTKLGFFQEKTKLRSSLESIETENYILKEEVGRRKKRELMLFKEKEELLSKISAQSSEMGEKKNEIMSLKAKERVIQKSNEELGMKIKNLETQRLILERKNSDLKFQNKILNETTSQIEDQAFY